MNNYANVDLICKIAQAQKASWGASCMSAARWTPYGQDCDRSSMNGHAQDGVTPRKTRSCLQSCSLACFHVFCLRGMWHVAVHQSSLSYLRLRKQLGITFIGPTSPVMLLGAFGMIEF